MGRPGEGRWPGPLPSTSRLILWSLTRAGAASTSPLTTRSEVAAKNLMDQSRSLRLTVQPGKEATSLHADDGTQRSGPSNPPAASPVITGAATPGRTSDALAPRLGRTPAAPGGLPTALSPARPLGASRPAASPPLPRNTRPEQLPARGQTPAPPPLRLGPPRSCTVTATSPLAVTCASLASGEKCGRQKGTPGVRTGQVTKSGR